MARSQARIHVSVWNDDDFLALSDAAQRLYFLALSQPGVNLCGVVSYTARRWGRLSATSSVRKVRDAVKELERDHFVMVDEDTEELWIRSFVRHDGVLDSPNALKGMVRDFATICSHPIRNGFLDGLPDGVPDDIREGIAEGITKGIGNPSRARSAESPRPSPPPRPRPSQPDPIEPAPTVNGSCAADDDDSATQAKPPLDTLVEAALALIARNDLERRQAEHGPVGDEPKWLASALVRRRDTLGALGATLLDETPTLTVAALAERLVPKAAPKAGPASVVDGTQRAARQREAEADAAMAAEREAAANGAVTTGDDAKAQLAAVREALR